MFTTFEIPLPVDETDLAIEFAEELTEELTEEDKSAEEADCNETGIELMLYIDVTFLKHFVVYSFFIIYSFGEQLRKLYNDIRVWIL